MTNYYRTLYISAFKVPYAVIYPPETVADLRWVSAPPQPVRPKVRLVPELTTFHRIEVISDQLGHISWLSQQPQPQRRPAQVQVSFAGPILDPSPLAAFSYKPFGQASQPILRRPLPPPPIYDNGSDLGAWYVAPTVLGLFTTSPQPVRPAPRLLQTDGRTPVVPELIHKPFLPQPNEVIRPAPRLLPQSTFNLNVPTITIDAAVSDFTPTELPRAKPRGPWPHVDGILSPERFIVTLDKWLSPPTIPIQPVKPLVQGGNFAPPAMATFDVISWWAPSPLPIRPPARMPHTQSFNCGLPLPGDPLNLSNLRWYVADVFYPTKRTPGTQSTLPNFTGIDLAVTSWGIQQLQPIRPPVRVPDGGSWAPPVMPTLENLRWLSPQPQPQPTPKRLPPMQPAYLPLVVAIDYPQVSQPIIVRPRQVFVEPTNFTPPALIDPTIFRFDPPAAPIRERPRGPVIDRARTLEPSLFVVPTPMPFANQPMLPVRPPIRGAWPQPSMLIFRPLAATGGIVEDGQVFTPHMEAAELFAPHLEEGQIFTPHVEAAQAD